MKIDRAAGGTQVFENAVVSDGPERTGTHFHVDVAVSGTDKAGILLVHYEVDTAFSKVYRQCLLICNCLSKLIISDFCRTAQRARPFMYSTR